MSSLFEVVREFYLPHVVTDTDSNIGNRVTSAIKNLIAGTFEKVNESRVKVSDSSPICFLRSASGLAPRIAFLNLIPTPESCCITLDG
ncbi:hypothetical protein BK648_13030 [Pseudomonas poae]|uniref:Uncharacterized protein n=1 Tax=Pseudomonas poae TaxID=200451 RepID=A0A423F3D9_9PSED|nr:hypothetical protein [Pseudomonas poae]ROM49101.1 hypothetical protein BK648_13030 [Pseudomonas poae]